MEIINKEYQEMDDWEIFNNDVIIDGEEYEIVSKEDAEFEFSYADETCYTQSSISRFIDAGVKTNIHFVLSSKSIDEAINLLETDGFPKGINAVIFLLYKPVGEGKDKYVLSTNELRLIKFFELIDNHTGNFKIGFDSCSIPGVLNYSKKVDKSFTIFTDTCEGARFSAYISADMKMVPCSFDQKHIWSVDLNQNTIQHAWDSDSFQSFRNKLENSCKGCKDRVECYGGCPITPQVVLCSKEERDEYI
jgi:radical SAM protein with 4Fe4S-binding SPASM domain